MEEIAQGRVWTGNDAASLGLVDASGGFSRAVAIAKQKANIPQHQQVGSIVLSVFSEWFSISNNLEWLTKETKTNNNNDIKCTFYYDASYY